MSTLSTNSFLGWLSDNRLVAKANKIALKNGGR